MLPVSLAARDAISAATAESAPEPWADSSTAMEGKRRAMRSRCNPTPKNSRSNARRLHIHRWRNRGVMCGGFPFARSAPLTRALPGLGPAAPSKSKPSSGSRFGSSESSEPSEPSAPFVSSASSSLSSPVCNYSARSSAQPGAEAQPRVPTAKLSSPDVQNLDDGTWITPWSLMSARNPVKQRDQTDSDALNRLLRVEAL